VIIVCHSGLMSNSIREPPRVLKDPGSEITVASDAKRNIALRGVDAEAVRGVK